MNKIRFTIFIIFMFFAFSCLSEILPPSYRINWDAGVRGGIPNRTVIFKTIAAGATKAEIQSALDTCPQNQVVQLSSGTYNLSSTLVIPSKVTLRGAGISNTILQPAAAFSGSTIISFDNNFDESWSQPAKSIVSAVKDSDTISTTTAHGWVTGDLVLFDMLEQPAGNPPMDHAGSLGSANWVGRDSGRRCVGQLVKITSVVSPTSVTFSPPLYWSYANSPQGVKMTGITEYAGAEDLSLNGHPVRVRDNVGVFGAVNCWTKNIEVRGIDRRSYWVYNALWFEINGCLIHEGRPVGTDNSGAYISDRSYAPFLGPHATACLITDNILEKLTMGMCWEGNSSGNVFSYNFITNIWWSNTGDSPRRFGPLMHGPHPMMNLIEGNWSGGRIRADEYWGTSSHFTALRNRICQIDRGADDAQTWTVDVERRNWYWSFIGNLLGGTEVQEGNYELINGEPAPYSSSISSIWKIGYNSLGSGATSYDPSTLITMIRWGNWCYRTNDTIAGSGQTWHPNNVVDTTSKVIPDSFYLTSKPSSFGFLKWPPYDPSNPNFSPTNIPAGYRYVYGVNPPASSGGTQEPPPVVDPTPAPETIFGKGKFEIIIKKD